MLVLSVCPTLKVLCRRKIKIPGKAQTFDPDYVSNSHVMHDEYNYLRLHVPWYKNVGWDTMLISIVNKFGR